MGRSGIFMGCRAESSNRLQARAQLHPENGNILVTPASMAYVENAKEATA